MRRSAKRLGFALAILLLGVFGAAAPTETAAAAVATLMAAGDIACDPDTDSAFGGTVDATRCQDKATADLVSYYNPASVVALGDLQYEVGTLSKFQRSYHLNWGGRFAAKDIPVVGNHEYTVTNAQGYRDYFGIIDTDLAWFTIRGDWGIYNINSNCQVSTVNCPGLASWMKNHMASNPKRCTMAVWHQPRRSGVSGYSVSASQQFEDAFYAGGGDVVLNGHAHVIEVSNRIKPDGTADSTRGVKHFTLGGGGKNLYNFASSTLPSWTEWRAKSFGVGHFTLNADSYDVKIVKPDGTADGAVIYGPTHRTCS